MGHTAKDAPLVKRDARTAGRFILMAMSVAALAACQVTRPNDFDEPGVYQAVIDATSSSLGSGIQLVAYHTLWSPEGAMAQVEAFNSSRAIRVSYREANAEASRHLPGDLDVLILDKRILRLATAGPAGDDWWEELRSWYGSDGVEVLVMSRPGFSRDGRTAVLRYEVNCYTLCGSTHLAELQLKDGTWTVVRDVVYAVS